MAIIEVSDNKKIIVNDFITEVDELENAILYIAQNINLNDTQLKNRKVKIEISSKAKVGIVNDIKKQLAAAGIQQIDYYELDASKRSKYIME